MNYKTIANYIAKTYNLPSWEAEHRVEFAVEELELDRNNITPTQAVEIERCIAADLKAGK